MKKIFTKQILIFLILVVGFVFVVQVLPVEAVDIPGVTSSKIGSASANAGKQLAQGNSLLSQIFSFDNLPDFVNSFLANLANAALFLTSYVLIAAAHVLDVSIRLSLNIKDFVNATPAIYTVWKVLRDITGLFFIFYLLYAAIQMMTGLGKGSYGSTIKNIVIAGILINFSFFIVSVAIDFSNITSQAIYNAMVPNSQVVKINSTTGLKELVESGGKSDISNIFMNSLRIQSIYDVQGNKLGTNIKDPIKIVLIGFTGVVMMITTAASFIFASIAFIARLVILLFVLAFSSIWFAGMVIPEIRKNLDPIKNALVSQLIFMPVYFLLMYVALTIINGSQLFTAGNIGGVASTITGPNWIMPYIILAVNFAIIIFILNTPLAVGLSMGGMATSWMKKGMGNWNALNVWGGIGAKAGNVVSGAGTMAKNTAALLPQYTLGKVGSKLDKKWSNTWAGNTAIGRSVRAATTGKMAASKFGGAKSYDDRMKLKKDINKKQNEINANDEFFRAVYEKIRNPATTSTAIKDTFKKLTTEQVLALTPDQLKAYDVFRHLKSKHFKAIDENKDGIFTDEQKKDILDNRKKAINDAIVVATNTGDTSAVDDMIGEMDGIELLKLDPVSRTNKFVMENYTISQLKKMDEEKISTADKDAIKTYMTTRATPHRTTGWILNNW
jgi:hypothetical protein